MGTRTSIRNTRIDIGRIQTRARELSKSLLGGQFRAEVAAFIAVGEAPFWARGIAKPLGIPENKVAAELSRFAAGGLLIALSGAEFDRRTLYERGPSSAQYWQAGYELVERAAADEALRLDIDCSTVLHAYLDVVHHETRRAGAEP